MKASRAFIKPFEAPQTSVNKNPPISKQKKVFLRMTNSLKAGGNLQNLEQILVNQSCHQKQRYLAL